MILNVVESAPSGLNKQTKGHFKSVLFVYFKVLIINKKYRSKKYDFAKML